jgi:mannosyltransferase OCH1-like enzyme
MIRIKEIVIVILIIFLLFHKEILQYYDKIKYSGILRGDVSEKEKDNLDYIPKVIYKTGIDDYDKLPQRLKDIFKSNLKINPNFTIRYYSDKDSREFIKNNFSKDIINAYDKLIPGAYKADLFRYCILYKNGGIYSDLTQYILKPLDTFIDFEKDKLYLVKDIEHYKINGEGSSKGIQISFIAARPGNEIFLKAIRRIVKNVKDEYYGYNALYPTGPSLFYHLLKDYKNEYKIGLKETGQNKIVNENDETIIISKIVGHQQKILKNNDHYTVLWSNRRIYKSI